MGRRNENDRKAVATNNGSKPFNFCLSIGLIMFDFNYQKKFTQAEKVKRNQVFDFWLSQMENKKVIYNGQTLACIFPEKTREMLKMEGRTDLEIFQTEQSIIRDVENSKNCEILHDIPKHLYSVLQRQRKEHLIYENRIVPVPSKKTNVRVCAELSRCFTDNEIQLAGCFYRLRDFGMDGEISEVWRMDIAEYPRGFILPCLENDLIIGLRVSRNENDDRTFLLRSRFELIDKTGGSYGFFQTNSR